MALRDRLAEDRDSFEAVLAVATCRDSDCFGDLLWPPLNANFVNRVIMNHVFGVMFTTANRVFVVEEHYGELRFYAGGRGNEVYDQPNELGVFRSPGDAIRFAEAFLVRQLHPEQIAVRRCLPWVRDDVLDEMSPPGGGRS